MGPTDFQSHDGVVSSGTPAVDYEWEFSDLDAFNFNRLVSITYPERPDTETRRVVTMNYGDNQGSFDSRLSRVTEIEDSHLGLVSEYTYMGSSRRVSLRLGNGVQQSYIGGSGYDGLDRFGRIIDLEYDDVGSALIHRYQYGYDAMGNREYARVTQIETQQGTHNNDRSYLYAYDQLQRLIDSKLGKLNGDNDEMESTPIPLQSQWFLDNLGNWSGGTINDGSYVLNGDFNGDGNADPARKAHYPTNASNEITVSYANGTQNDTLIHDVVGNMTRQGSYIYQYDAWNRLVQVNLKGTATFDSAGHITGGTIGALKALYSYDGLGRLVRKEVPIPGESFNRIEDYYYDGVRRIQEVFDESGGGESMMAGGGSGGESMEGEGEGGESGEGESIIFAGPGARMLTPGPESGMAFQAMGASSPAGGEGEGEAEPIGGGDAEPLDPDDESTVIVLDENTLGIPAWLASEPLTPSEGSTPSGGPALLGGPGTPEGGVPGGPEGGGGGMMSMSSSTVWTDREYIWGPDYVDECIAQIDGDDYVMYVLQDANYNVVALLDEDGRALAQYTYTPYGAIHISESFEAHPINRLGHQGLFFERYNATINDPILVVNSQGLSYMRNRWYLPLLGRFTTRDPNATAAPILEALATNGTLLDVFVGSFDITTQYADGMNLYEYVGSDPVNKSDPSGLSEVIDDFLGAVEQFGGLGGGLLGTLRPIFEAFEQRNLELDRFVEQAAVGEIDLALAEYEESQLERWDLIMGGGWQIRIVANAGIQGFGALPQAFFAGAVVYQVYIGRDPKTKRAKYVGITSQPLKAREAQHGGKYSLKRLFGRLTKLKALAIEQLIKDNNPNFDNQINPISPRHKWRPAALQWAKRFVKGMRLKIR